MALISMRQLLDHAAENDYGVPAFNINNMEQALSIMRSEQPALVLMDMTLPVLDGWTACEQARDDSALNSIPIIALTAHAMASDRERALAAGCREYQTKPIDFPALLEKIYALLEEARCDFRIASAFELDST